MDDTIYINFYGTRTPISEMSSDISVEFTNKVTNVRHRTSLKVVIREFVKSKNRKKKKTLKKHKTIKRNRYSQLKKHWDESPYSLADDYSLAFVLNSYFRKDYSNQIISRNLNIFLSHVHLSISFRQIAERENLSIERVRQISYKMWRVLRHPSRIKVLAKTMLVPFKLHNECIKRFEACSIDFRRYNA